MNINTILNNKIWVPALSPPPPAFTARIMQCIKIFIYIMILCDTLFKFEMGFTTTTSIFIHHHHHYIYCYSSFLHYILLYFKFKSNIDYFFLLLLLCEVVHKTGERIVEQVQGKGTHTLTNHHRRIASLTSLQVKSNQTTCKHFKVNDMHTNTSGVECLVLACLLLEFAVPTQYYCRNIVAIKIYFNWWLLNTEPCNMLACLLIFLDVYIGKRILS